MFFISGREASNVPTADLKKTKKAAEVALIYQKTTLILDEYLY